jgi:hypothetical protein
MNVPYVDKLRYNQGVLTIATAMVRDNGRKLAAIFSALAMSLSIVFSLASFRRGFQGMAMISTQSNYAGEPLSGTTYSTRLSGSVLLPTRLSTPEHAPASSE